MTLATSACGNGIGTDDEADAARADAQPGFDARAADAAAPDAIPFSLTVAVVSDLNGSYGSTTYGSYVHSAVARIVEVAPDLVLSAGDMVAGQQSGLDYWAMWDGFHAAVSDPLAAAGIPLAVTPGNHDASAYSGYEEERSIYAAEWNARRPAVELLDDTDYPFRYSFAVGEARFVSLDNTKVGALSADQMTWLAGALADSDQYAATIVFGHVPLYPIADGDQEVIGDPALEALLVENDADLFITGHAHAYFPGRRDSGLRLLAMACLGSGGAPLIGEATVSPRSFALIEISGEGITGHHALTGADFDTEVPRDSLPGSIGSGDRVIIRDDL